MSDRQRQKPTNTHYPIHRVINSAKELEDTALYDHVAGLFKDNHRHDKNFISADCIIMDCDNDDTENSAEWITPEKVAERLQGVQFYTIYSRNHMRDKRDDETNEIKHTARPRFHLYFPLSGNYTECTRIRDFKEAVLKIMPEFDSGAKDASRNIYGVENPVCEVFEGEKFIDEFIDEFIQQEMLTENTEMTNQDKAEDNALPKYEDLNGNAVFTGHRHKEMIKSAVRFLANYGVEKARRMFIERSLDCVPQLPKKELDEIWKWATKNAGEFKKKYEQKKINLTLPVLEDVLQKLNINVRMNVITHKPVISDLPLDSEFTPQSYKNADAIIRRKANETLLPLFLTSYLKENNYAFSEAFLDSGLNGLIITTPYNPFLDMLQNTVWDGENRINDLCNVLNITGDDVHYTRFLVKWLWQVVSMALNDDSSLGNEFVLVLQGPQGVGKTTFFKKLAMFPEWFLEGASIDTRVKDNIMDSTRVLICELGELDATLTREQSSLKAFLTRHDDTYRAPYGRNSIQYERRTTFCATVNPEQFLRDPTGSRRFVVIPVTDMDKYFMINCMTPEYMRQLWRQVYEQYYLRHGRTGFYLTNDERKFSEDKNAQSNVMVDGEIEIFDMLDWTQPVTVWKWYTNSELIDMLDLKITAQKMGRALTSVLAKDKRAKKENTMYCKRYLLPPKKQVTYGYSG
jgi:hypothetical protein